VLTVGAGVPNSHRRRGWEQFTDGVIRALNDKPERVVFLLWGGAAQKKARLVTSPQHCVITAAHPAARANAKKQLVGSGVFSLANKALSRKNRVDWGKG
jgi:uracil DNA glycosylase